MPQQAAFLFLILNINQIVSIMYSMKILMPTAISMIPPIIPALSLKSEPNFLTIKVAPIHMSAVIIPKRANDIIAKLVFSATNNTPVMAL